MAQVFAGLFTEGSTDLRFLEPIVRKTLTSVAFDCSGQIDIEISLIEIDKTGLNFVEQILKASKDGFRDFGIMMLCVQTDADNKTLQSTYQSKIIPAVERLKEQDENLFCRILTAIIPIQETEAWMLADKELLKREIGTEKTDNELEINRFPEDIANPKEVIENAIRIARANLTKKRRSDLNIADLYFPIGQSIDIEKLETLSSFQNFKENVRVAFRTLNLLH
ncbi:MAG: DUF4276 family protein [Spirosomaceae bacterium]|jgi:hypothetical protein|nr:DUF4276 family protein [Spirosomataceae bacterium]